MKYLHPIITEIWVLAKPMWC